MNSSAIAANAILSPPEAEPVMPANTRHADGFIDQGIRYCCQGVAHQQETRQCRDDTTEFVLGRRVHGCEEGSADRRFRPFGKAAATLP